MLKMIKQALVVLVLCYAVAVMGCKDAGSKTPSGSEAPLSTQPDAGRSTARTLPIPGTSPRASPHAAPQPQLGPSPKATAGNGLAWSVPASWQSVPPRNSVRLEQYRVPGSGGDCEFVVFYFGPGQGGDPLANAFRWARQFSSPDGRPPEALVDLQQLDGTAWPTQWMEIRGDYSGGMSDDPIAGAMLLAGVVEGPDAPWFFKLVGPEPSMSERKAEFLELLRSVRSAP